MFQLKKQITIIQLLAPLGLGLLILRFHFWGSKTPKTCSEASEHLLQLTNWDKDEKVLQVKIVSSEILKIIIEFMYTLDVGKQITNNNVVDLLQAANIYDLRLLREECVLFLKQRICASNILEVLDIPIDKMRLILMSKLLILRDEQNFPLKAVPREGKILNLVLEYLQYKNDSRLESADKLLPLVKFHLLPLDTNLQFSQDRFLPSCVMDLMTTKLTKYPDCVQMLTQTEMDVKYLHQLSDPSSLYKHTHSNIQSILKRNDVTANSLNERHTNWDSKRAREASICHEWWTAHAHDSRFIPSATNSNVKITAISGSCGSEKFIKKITFYIWDVNDNNDLLPEWFNLAPQYNMNNMNQELGEYIAALHVIWSDGTSNRIGDHGDLKRGVSVSLETGEHIIKTFQLFWGPRQVFVPLEVVDFIFVTSKGRKFGPFTRQVTKLYHEAECPKKEWSFHDIRHKLNSKKIHRRVDNPLNPMCRPANITELSTSNLERLEDDSTWSSWLDGFLCITKNRKITRITLKFAVYLDCYYRESQQGQNKKPTESEAPILYSYTLQDLKQNTTGKPIKIHDHDYLWDNMVTPFASDVGKEASSLRKRIGKDWTGYDDPMVISLEDNWAEPHNIHNSVQNVIHHILEPANIPPPLGPLPGIVPVDQEPAAEPVGDNNNGEADDAGEDGEENAENNNNNNEDNGEDDEEEAQEPNIHDDVWDALISDDLRQIGELYQKKTLNIDEYLE